MPDITQDGRFLKVETPLEADELMLLSFSGYEEISKLFSFQLEMISLKKDIDFNGIVGKNVTFSVETSEEGGYRCFNGYVTRFSQLPGYGGFYRYHAEVSPFLWFLTRTADCRIFQNKTVPDIIKQIFADYGLTDYKDSLVKSYQTWDYCTQYRETACNFVMRLMEQEGIFFFFTHENGKHTLVLADAPSAHKACPDQSSFSFEGMEGWHPQADDSISSWRRDQVIQPAAYTLGDYNFEKPALDLTANQTGSGSGNWEIYDYPGEYDSKSEGDTYANIRLEEQESPGIVITGAGTGRSFATGYKFDLKEHYRSSENAMYVLTSVNHSAYEGGTYPGLNGGAEQTTYSNTFTCIPIAVPFRPPRVTPRPQMQGSQTAFVVGPAGEEIYVDKYGRVKVQFHWDRRGKNDENSSCWIRVSHLWAGKGWGAVFTPRIGQEVIVDFLEGDPDQPIITGRVYNATAVVPYTLPDEQTKSTLKSYSSKGGGGFNEFRFEDKKGSEQIFIHAEKDQHDRIKNDRYEIVGRDSHLIVTKDQMEQVKGDKHLQVEGDQNEKVDGSVSLKAGQDLQQKVGMKMALDAGQEIHLKAGMNLVVESGTNLTLKVGGNFININPGGIFIKGTMVMLNSGGSAGSGAGSNPAVPKAPKEADKAEPGSAITLPPSKAPPRPFRYSPQATVLKQAAQSGVPFCDI